MKILEVNSIDLFSTGNIMLNIAQTARERGHEVLTASKYNKTSVERHRNDPNHFYIGNRLTNTIHRYWAWMTDLQDTGSVFSTLRFIRKIEQFNPDVIHLHDILGWYLNLEIFMQYIRRKKIPVVWTFHDCWAFTGRCIYFDAAKCDRWKHQCGNCPQKGYMPGTWWFDLSKWNHRRKRKLFTSIDNLTIVTPSEWLGNLTLQSFLKNVPVKVINNGINLDVFKPTKGNMFQTLKADNKKIILGVAGTWSKRKGLDDFIWLSRNIPDNYKIVLVGLDKEAVPAESGIETIQRTHNQQELAEIYTAADVFANPTYEDNFPTVNLESLACGTPVVTYKTGGSPESVTEQTGRVVTQGDMKKFRDALIEISSIKADITEICREAAKKYAMSDRFNDYVDLLEECARQ